MLTYLLDAADCMNESPSDKETASKLKKKLEEDPEMNVPSVTNTESMKEIIILFF